MTTTVEGVDISRLLSAPVTLPPKQRWSRRALARFLKTQGLLGSDPHTLDNWERGRKLWRVIPEFRRQIPKDEKGNYYQTFPFTPYQAWIVVKTAYILTALRDDLRGCQYLPQIARTFANKDVQKKFLSKEIWMYELSEVA